MKYLKSYRIFEELVRPAVIQFGNYLTMNCELDKDGQNWLIVSNMPEIVVKNVLVDDDDMKETFSPLRKLGINVEYKGSKSILQDEEYGGGYSEDIEGYFKVNVDELNNAIKSGSVVLEPESAEPDEEYFNLKIVRK